MKAENIKEDCLCLSEGLLHAQNESQMYSALSARLKTLRDEVQLLEEKRNMRKDKTRNVEYSHLCKQRSNEYM